MRRKIGNCYKQIIAVIFIAILCYYSGICQSRADENPDIEDAQQEPLQEGTDDLLEAEKDQPPVAGNIGTEQAAVVDAGAFANDIHAGDQFSGYISLYSDRKARRVGDIVTIIIVESSKASKSSVTQTSKKSGSDGTLSNLFGLGNLPLSMGVDAGSNYSGSGTTSRNGSMEAKISTSVKQVLPNGNLVLEGTRQVTVNDDVQIITVSGIVQPQSIRSDNSVLSIYMADAQIKYVGEGPTAQKPGIVTRILQTPFHWVAGIFRRIF